MVGTVSPSPRDTRPVPLPIDKVLPELLAAIESSPCVVLRASPGSGKTTRVPPALLGLRALGNREVLVLEPRRLAARLAACRVADERNEPVGQTVGYQFRFETVAGKATRIRFLTEGTFIRKLLHDPKLSGAGAVVLDEFHERHLQTDLALAAVRRLQQTSRPDLKLVVMSATLETAAISSYLGDCPVVSLDSPLHPLTIWHLEAPPARALEAEVVTAVKTAWGERPDASILVFLPGMREILASARALEPLSSRGDIFPLHGSLSREEQDRAIMPSPRPRVILSTNVAESSLTIEGINCVVDSGLHRQASHSWWTGLPSLRTRPISRASAIQRAGRAGRTEPGLCLRLYTEADFRARAAFEKPELLRSDLTQAWLELMSWGIARPESELQWIDPPPTGSVEAAVALLQRLGAVGSDGKVTPLGTRLAEIPTHPRFARLLVEAERRGAVETACRLVAVASEDGFPSLDALEAVDTGRVSHSARRTEQQLLRAFSGTKGKGGDRDSLARALLTAFPDRVAQRRATASARARSGEEELVFSSGGSGLLPLGPLTAHADTFIAPQVEETQGARDPRAKIRVRAVCPIEIEWLLELEPSAVTDSETLEWDATRSRVVSRSRTSYDALVLEERTRPANPSPEAARVLLKQGVGLDLGTKRSAEQWVEALARVADRDTLETLLARLVLIRPADPEGLSWLERAIQNAAAHVTSLAELRATAWEDELASGAGVGAGELARLTPTHITLPSQRRAPVSYPLGRDPYLASRLQDFFGLKESPRILGGKVALTLHLLAPNKRAVQVTSDLTGFWQRHYPSIRKELARKYPRHAWPEDPLKPPSRKDFPGARR